MRLKLVVFIILLSLSFSFAQQDTINRLKYKLNHSAADSAKASALDSLSMYSMFFSNKSDSTYYYINKYINYAFNFSNKKYLILAYARMGFYYINTSQYKEALNISLKGINLSEEYHIPNFLSALYYNLAWVYLNLQDNPEALNNAFKGIFFLKDNQDPFYDQTLHLNGIIGNIYLYSDKPDSAYYYFHLVDSIAANSKELAAKDITEWYWGMYYLFKKNYAIADSVLSIGIASCQKSGDFLLNFFLIFSAQSNLAQGNLKKAIANAHFAYVISQPLNDPAGAGYAASLLNTCYEKSGNRDSAYYYLKMSNILNNQIKKHSNANEIQQIRFDKELSQKEQEANLVLQNQKNRNKIMLYVFLTALLFFLAIVIIQWRNNKQKKKANVLLQEEKDKVDRTLLELKSTQAQLIHSEKMASLGELTAGIAHEIKNPLNFVNNFSEVSTDLITEMLEEADKGNTEEVKAIAEDLKQNLEKINHHGKRADSIVKGMLLHSRGSSGEKALTDINDLLEQYVNLAYHGMRAQNKDFNITIERDYDKSLDKINVVPQDISRVFLNIINNGCYAANDKKKKDGDGFSPTIKVSTKNLKNKVEIRIADNGNGVPEKIRDKLFQPFFTTKPTGEGTGLGLSLSYDIVVKQHGGEIKVESKEGDGAEFVITLPYL
jgi:two-component system, NtrC family, sensor kinase